MRGDRLRDSIEHGECARKDDSRLCGESPEYRKCGDSLMISPTLELSTKWLIMKERGRTTAMSEFVIPKSGLIPAPEVAQPNIFPMEWRVETPKLAEIYERAKREGYNPSALPWESFDANDFSQDQRVAMMYWFALLSNFDASGPAVFAKATIHAFEQHEEDPVRKCFFSITRDEMNHEETCGRAITMLVPGGPVEWVPKSELERVAYNNIKWLYHNGGRYWSGYPKF